MVITLEVQHSVKPGREQEVMALIKGLGRAGSEQYPESFTHRFRTSEAYSTDPMRVNSFFDESDLCCNWANLLETPARIKLRMSV